MSNSQPNTSTQNNDKMESSAEQPVEMAKDDTSKKTKRLFRLVPEIGLGWRWYDVPYRFLEWWLESWRRYVVPPVLRRLINRGKNFFLAFYEYDFYKDDPLDGPLENLTIPEKMQLLQGGIWTIELFPPSQFKTLERSFQRNGWNISYFTSIDEPSSQKLRRAREGRGFGWSLIGTISRFDSKYLLPDVKHEDLPKEIEYIKLTAIQLGTSVTALVAFFQLSDAGVSSLDRVWRKTHEPTLTWKGFHRPRVTNRYFASIEATQHERMRIHNLARKWVSLRCPGFFSSKGNVHPVLDLNLFKGFDPLLEGSSRETRDAMRALGLGDWELEKYISPQLKGTTLIPTFCQNGPHEPLKNCWSIAGEYRKVVNENERPGYGDKPYSAGMIGHMFGDAASAFLLHLAMNSYLSEQNATYSLSRDLASTRHRRFKARKARKLSFELLETGLDLPAVARDSRYLISKRWYVNIEVQVVPAGLHKANMEPFDLIELFNKNREAGFQELIEQDESYRTVLSTVAALGASADAAWTGRVALFVAAGSMIVATITLLITQTSDTSLLSSFIEWLGRG